MQIFDCLHKPSPKVKELLKATSCAPAYFESPTRMGLRNYVDGGITGDFKNSNWLFFCSVHKLEKILAGNNSTGVGIPWVLEVWPEGFLATVLNLAPPVQDAGKKMEDMSYHIKKLFANIGYIVHQATDGTATFVQSQKNNPGAFMQRLTPKSPDTAVVIALRAITEPLSEEHMEMFIAISTTLQKRRESNAGIHLGTQLLAKQIGRNLFLYFFNPYRCFQKY